MKFVIVSMLIPLVLRQRRATIILAGALLALPSHAQMLNGSFEAVPSMDGSELGQGLLPSSWVSAANITPGADTYSGDVLYGLAPADFGHFAGRSAADGIRWVAGADFGGGTIEAIATAVSFAPSTSYTIGGSLLLGQGQAAGGYRVSIAPNPSVDDPGIVHLGLLSPTITTPEWVSSWQLRDVTFTAPANAADLGWLILAPMGVDGGSTYVGIDNVFVTPVPEPAEVSLAIGALLLGVGAWRRRHAHAGRACFSSSR